MPHFDLERNRLAIALPVIEDGASSLPDPNLSYWADDVLRGAGGYL